MRRFFIIAGLLVVLLAGLWFFFGRPDTARLPLLAVTGARPTITTPREQMIPTMRVPKAVGWPRGAAPTPAAGLRVTLFADGLDHPRWLYRLPNGDVLVAETNAPPDHEGGVRGAVKNYLKDHGGASGVSANRITLLRDANGDGSVDQRSVLVTGLNSPFGMALVGPWLYVANTDALIRFPFTPGQTRITAKPELVVKLPAGGDHWARNVVAAPDGKTLFVSVGSSTNIADNGLDDEQNRADILEVVPDTRSYRIFAAGTRNPVGLAFDPRRKALWATVQERDMIGSDGPPDYMSAIELGDHFGWPWYYWGGYPDKRATPDNPALQQYVKRPDFALGPHVSALGLAFAAEARLGPSFADGAFVAEHGSWNRVPVSGYKVVFVPFGANGFPLARAKPVDVLAGFLGPDGRARGRPVGLAVDRTGALLVADDSGNRVWRISRAR